MMNGIRAMERADINGIIEVMAKAFQNAALYRYLEPDERRRADFLRIVFRRRVTFAFDTHDADVAYNGKTITGAALWSRPDSEPRENRALENAVQEFGGIYEKWRRFHEVLFKAFDDAVALAGSKPHWSLAPIAVAPEARGQGAASALIRHKLALIDQSGFPCLLGTQDEVNLKIYARYGFKVIHTVPAAKGEAGKNGLVCYIMMREKG